jgi:hypothetical protein
MRVSAQALPKSFRVLCKEQSEADSYPWPEIRIGNGRPLPVDPELATQLTGA